MLSHFMFYDTSKYFPPQTFSNDVPVVRNGHQIEITDTANFIFVGTNTTVSYHNPLHPIQQKSPQSNVTIFLISIF
jgi:hypothetical protein